MLRLFKILLVGSTTLFLASNSIGYSFVEKAVQKRIGMFKSSGANLKKLSKLISAGNFDASGELVDFHVEWSANMLHVFPEGSEASTSNGSDASSDIWRDPTGFQKRVNQYNLSAIDLREALKSKNISLINKNFHGLVESCKRCHNQFRN